VQIAFHNLKESNPEGILLFLLVDILLLANLTEKREKREKGKREKREKRNPC